MEESKISKENSLHAMVHLIFASLHCGHLSVGWLESGGFNISTNRPHGLLMRYEPSYNLLIKVALLE